MRVCITGATGFVGGALVRRLLNDGTATRVLARPSPRADALEALGVEVIRGDLSDAQAVERAVSGAEAVYHAAAKVAGGKKDDFSRTNADGTANLLSACASLCVSRVVYLSSIAVYGLAPGGELIDENTPLDPDSARRDFYAQSKIAADEFAFSFGAKSGLPIAILRPGLVYGPGRPLPVGLLGVRFGKANFVFGSSSNRIPLNYIENLLDAIQLASRSKISGPRSYIVLDDDDLTLARYHLARAQLDQSRAIFLPGWPVTFASRFANKGSGMSALQVRRALEDRHYSTQRIRDELGWSPKVPLPEAISRTLRARGTTDHSPFCVL